MRKCFAGFVTLAAVAAVAAVFVASAGAYGGGATHDTWQVGLSFNCDNPSSPLCQGPQGEPELGGFWGWVEFDRSGTQTWGDAQLTGCGHTTGGGGPGSAGAGHESVDITSWHLGPAQPDDPNFGTPGAQDFYIDGNVVTSNFHGTSTTTTDDPDFLGDSGIPAEPGHYAFHPAPAVSGNVQVSFRPAR